VGKIPSYGTGPEVADERLNLPQVDGRVPLAALGGGEAAAEVTQQEQGLAGDAARIAFERQRKAKDDATSMELLEINSQLTAAATRAKTALQGRQGKNAIGGREDTLSGYDKFYENLSKGIQDEDIKRMAFHSYQQHKAGLDAFASPYEQAQLQHADNQDLTAAMKTEQESAAADPTPANVAVATMSQKLALEEFGKRNGMGEAWLKQAQKDASSATHFMALHSIATGGDYVYARAFYEANKDEFVGNDAINAKKLVEAGDLRGDAQRETQRILAGKMQGNDVGPAQMPTEPQALAEADKIQDPKLQDMVRDRLKDRYADARRIQHESQVQDITDAANIIEQNPSLDAIPIDLYDRLPMSARSALQTRVNQIKKGEGPKAGSDAYLRYVREQATDPDVFVKRNFGAMRDEITDAEVKELTKDQANIIKGDERTARKNNSLLSVMQKVDGRLKALGVDDKDDIDAVKNAVDRDYHLWKSDPKNANRPMEPDESDLLISRILGRKRAFLKFGFGRELTPIIRRIEDVPDADVAAIREALKKNGEIPTEGAIIEAYNEAHK